MLEKLKAMFSPGPKDRNTAGYLAVLLGWAGIHKFYLGYRNVGVIHAGLTGVGLLVLLAQFTGDGAVVIPVYIVALLALVGGYFYVQMSHFGRTMAEAANPGRVLLTPWRLLRYTFRLTRAGSDIMGEEEEERRWRRRERRMWGRGRGRGRRRGRRYDDDDDDDDEGCGLGCWVIALGIVLSLAVIGLIIFLYFVIISLIGFIAIGGSIAIGVVEGLGYLKKTDAEFQQEYVVNQRLWF